ncbi:universal stress protein [Streptomyces sp. NPDC127069]|uniref:universal stress protein n=1 Tax=Streptomyces sp. NPDC127069 TaxID=3347128 RepID=UPI00365182A1
MRRGAGVRLLPGPPARGAAARRTQPASPGAAAATAPGAADAATATALARVLDQGRHSFPGLHVTAEIRPGHPARRLLDASHAAALVVIGRRNRDSRLGQRTGGLTRTLLHRSRTPVAVVPHD